MFPTRYIGNNYKNCNWLHVFLLLSFLEIFFSPLYVDAITQEAAFFLYTYTQGTAERTLDKKSENLGFSLGSVTEQKLCSFGMPANFSKSQFSCL